VTLRLIQPKVKRKSTAVEGTLSRRGGQAGENDGAGENGVERTATRPEQQQEPASPTNRWAKRTPDGMAIKP
jgi:hypothetical protein